MKTNLYTINSISIIEMIYLMMWQDKDGLDLFEHYCNLIFISKTVYKTIKNEFDNENDYKIKPDTNQLAPLV